VDLIIHAEFFDFAFVLETVEINVDHRTPPIVFLTQHKTRANDIFADSQSSADPSG
jgi:hypothetical protein